MPMRLWRKRASVFFFFFFARPASEQALRLPRALFFFFFFFNCSKSSCSAPCPISLDFLDVNLIFAAFCSYNADGAAHGDLQAVFPGPNLKAAGLLLLEVNSNRTWERFVLQSEVRCGGLGFPGKLETAWTAISGEFLAEQVANLPVQPPRTV